MLKKAFAPCGEVIGCQIKSERKGRSKGKNKGLGGGCVENCLELCWQTDRCPAPGWVVFATEEGQKKAAATMNEEGQREHETYCAPVYGRCLMIRYETLNHCMEWCILFF